MKKCVMLVSAISVFGCANNPFSSYKNTSDKTINNLYTGNINIAEAESTTDTLANLEDGSLKRMQQNYPLSNQRFSLAQQNVDIWTNNWLNTTAGKITTTTTSLLINDNANEYDPKGYEKTFLTTYHALNHIDLNNWANARIEIKRMYQVEQAIQNYNQVLYNQETIDAKKRNSDKAQSAIYQQIITKYDFSDINSPKVLALKNSYQNAFSHYLAGFVFEALNEPSLARPGYVKAGQLNPTNSLIQSSIDNIDKQVKPLPGYTDLLIIEETGHAPQLKSEELHIPFNMNLVNKQNTCINTINIFFPKLVADINNNKIYNFNLDNASYTPMPMVDVDLMTERYLHDQLPHIISRNVAAAVRNIATSQAACTTGGSLGTLLSLGTSIGGLLLDKADERTWTLLPSKIYVNRTKVAYGKHAITVYVNGRPHTEQITLNKPYQIVVFRVIGTKVFFNIQN